ncbi:MAG: SMP-30/gluconolactonase/LRE family protein [Planctomycetales bacterium]|nr:SMP-30/gluconolactonase/LRE family protein [Planctomycetales bacterium]
MHQSLFTRIARIALNSNSLKCTQFGDSTNVFYFSVGRTYALTLIVLVVLINSCWRLGTLNAQSALGKIERLETEFDQLVPRDAKIEILASGFTWTEGPVWVGGSDGHLLFSDIPRNSIFKWTQDNTISLFMSPSGYTGVTYYGLEPGSNGLFLDQHGRLVMCEHGDRRLSVLTEQGGKLTLADRYQGKRFNSPNDGALKSNGDIYFTDPPYGLPDRFTDRRREIPYCGVYRVDVDGQVTLLTKDIERPNGIAFSPDEKFLYIAQSNPEQANWTAFPVNSDGTLEAGKEIRNVTGRVGVEPGLPDGMTVDSAGHLWASGPGGIYVMNPDGKLLGRLVTGERTSNCTFGPNGFLYVTADAYLCRVKTNSNGIERH